MLAEIFERADEFDVIHSHVDVWTLPFAYSAEVPTLLTMHGRLDLDPVRQALELYPGIPLVSISNDQRRALEGIDVTWAGTVYNGLDLRGYASQKYEGSRHLAFVGRISVEKGPVAAVEVAARTNRQLRVAAKVDPTDVEYFERVVDPVFSANDVLFVGEIGEDRKPGFFGCAAATVFPSDWPEPFGLVMIESMAAGTPVIALRRGSVPEIVVDGVTGFICDDIDGMVEAVNRIDEIDRDECRRRAAEFDVAAMCEGYEAIYDELSSRSARALDPTG
jgi:glycosyltransferase involved in cell wall biosynthesis